jgi:hypothetical protein
LADPAHDARYKEDHREILDEVDAVHGSGQQKGTLKLARVNSIV